MNELLGGKPLRPVYMVRLSTNLDDFGDSLGIRIAIDFDVGQVSKLIGEQDELQGLVAWLKVERTFKHSAGVAARRCDRLNVGICRNGHFEAVAAADTELGERSHSELCSEALR